MLSDLKGIGFCFPSVLLELFFFFSFEVTLQSKSLHTEQGWWGQGQEQMTLCLKAADGSVEMWDAPHRAQKAGVPLNLFLGWSGAALQQQRHGK